MGGFFTLRKNSVQPDKSCFLMVSKILLSVKGYENVEIIKISRAKDDFSLRLRKIGWLRTSQAKENLLLFS